MMTFGLEKKGTKKLRDERQNHMEITWKSHESSFRLDVGSIMLNLVVLILLSHATFSIAMVRMSPLLSGTWLLLNSSQNTLMNCSIPGFLCRRRVRLMWLKMMSSTFMAIKAQETLSFLLCERCFFFFFFSVESTNCTVTVIFLKLISNQVNVDVGETNNFYLFRMHFLCFFSTEELRIYR